MSTYHGLCSYPHGGRSVSFLWFALVGATICTCYSISSCRLVVLTYTSNLGHFEDHFVNFDALSDERHTVGLGLFTWLRPSFYVDGDDDTVTRATVGNWREGSCVGYNTLQLEDILDPTMEAVRILGVVSILLAFSVFLFSLMLSCLSLAAWQRYILSAACLFAGIGNGLVLLMLNSDLCTSMGTSGTSSCVMDQGGLVSIAAVILWVCAALLTYFYIEPVRDPGMHDKMVSQRQSQKRKASLQQIRKENKTDWNNNSSSHSGKSKRQSSKKSDNKKKQTDKKPKMYASFSLPKQQRALADRDDGDEDDQNSQSDAAQKKQKPRHNSAPPKVSAPIMLTQARTAATNKSLETKYIPRTQSAQYGTYDYAPVDPPAHHSAGPQDHPRYYSSSLPPNKSNDLSAAEQDAIIRGVSQKLADPHSLNREESRSMLSSLTSPSFAPAPPKQQQRQITLNGVLADDLATKPKNDALCCGVGV
ncbi:expressed unknown protein [Seminavis robusta]|uniref:Uncharacterized protein n=1 Tax=Seminavis robusta TaxID=568900 RepID=A0A9N8DLC4_9STRA|nr:expressed unknown protein [Seminavis robusta]|eukprot:Sro205_g086330.1 n/a (476) ;mRNA; r:73762-75287